LTFKITGGDLAASDYNSTYKLVMRKFCDVIPTDLIGSYASSRDYDRALTGAVSGAKYSSSVSNWTPLTATSASVTIKNLAATSDIGFGPFAATAPIALNGVTAILDWTNPAARVTSLLQQDNIADGGSVNPQYAGISTVTVTNPSATSFPGVRGTFSICNQTLVLKMRVCLLPLGCFGTTMYTVNMAR
jgi:hypothetical protein